VVKEFDIRMYCSRTRTAHSYSPGGANVHPHQKNTEWSTVCTCSNKEKRRHDCAHRIDIQSVTDGISQRVNSEP